MRTAVALLALLGLSTNLLVNAARQSDKVTSLPDCDRLQTDWYSGYVDASPTKHLHYVLVTSKSDPVNDPLVIWFNGGPGCSSLLALFAEHGPYVVDDGEYYIKSNSEPWNKRANILYIESPSGVGYSIADTDRDLLHNDMSQSQDAFAFLKGWYALFPEYKKNDLYVSGESYGGIYVPYLAWQIHQHNQQSLADPTVELINLKGFIVGNGATNWEVDISQSFPDVVYNFNIIPQSLLDTYHSNNCHNYFNDLKPATDSKICSNTWDKINDYASGLNWYDLYRKVYPDGGILKSAINKNDEHYRLKSVIVDGEEKTYKSGFTMKEYTPWAKHIEDHEKHPLLGDYMSDYVNRPDVRKALNIPSSAPGWQQCNNFINSNYAYQYEGSFWIYKILMQYNYKILFFSGDTDGAVPTYGTRRWIKMLGLPVKESWKSWITDGQVSGYIIRYEGLDFATVHGVGHMAPQWKRKDVTKLFTNWIHNEPIM